jgi:hypothetical protein
VKLTTPLITCRRGDWSLFANTPPRRPGGEFSLAVDAPSTRKGRLARVEGLSPTPGRVEPLKISSDLGASRSLKSSSKAQGGKESSESTQGDHAGTRDRSAEPPLGVEQRAAAAQLLKFYAACAGLPVAYFKSASFALVAKCLRDMDGSTEACEYRLRAVIEDAVAESLRGGYPRPTLEYVFGLKHVRRRLNRLAEQAAAVDESDGFAAGAARQLADAERAQEQGQGVAIDLTGLKHGFATGLVTHPKLIKRFRQVEAKAARISQETAQYPVSRLRPPSSSSAGHLILTPNDTGVGLPPLPPWLVDLPEPRLATATPLGSKGLTLEEREELEAAQNRARQRQSATRLADIRESKSGQDPTAAIGAEQIVKERS